MMKNSLIMASLLASLAAAPVIAQTDEAAQKKTETTPDTVARSPQQRMKAAVNAPLKNTAANARRRL